MAQLIIYAGANGSLSLAYPASADADIEQLASAVVPAGQPYRVVDSSDLPGDSAYSSAWTTDLLDAEAPITVNTERQAAIDKKAALDGLDLWFAEEMETGYVTPDGWRLGMTPTDVTLLTGHYVLAKEAAALGAVIPPIIDTDGVPHAFDDIGDLTALMLAYGQARAALSSAYAIRKAAIS